MYETTPPLARSTDPDTSHEAPKEIPISVVQDNILQLMEDLRPHYPYGMTDDQIREQYAKRHLRVPSESSLRTRRKELVRKALVHPTGFPGGKSAKGNKATLWGAGEEP